MGFLSPLLLLAGAAVAVPLVLHLVHRHRGPRLPFPALRYLRRAERERARSIRLRQLLLLLLRTAVIVLVTLAAARPLLPGGAGGHLPTAVAIVLDNSMSTGAVVGEERLFDSLRRLALATASTATAEDRLWVIRAAEPDDPARPSGPEEAVRRIEATGVLPRRAALDSAVARARTLVAGSGLPGREVHLLSDLQATSFTDDPGEAGERGSGGAPEGAARPSAVVFRPGDAPPANRAVAGVTVGGGLAPREDEAARVAVTLAAAHRPGDSPGTGDSTTVRVAVGGRVRAATRAPAEGTALLSLPPLPAGSHPAYAEIDADALRADDRRYFVLRVRPPPAVAVAGPAPAFLSEAVAVLEEARRIRRAGVAGAGVILSVEGVGAGELSRGARVAVVPPDDPTGLPALNRRLARAGIPWELVPRGDAAGGRIAEGAPAGLAGIRIDRLYTLRDRGAGGGEGEVRARLGSGEPWLVEGRVGEGRYLIAASPLEPGATPLPLSARMVPFVAWITGRWGEGDGGGGDLVVGEPFPVGAGSVVEAVSGPGAGGTLDGTGGTQAPRTAPEPGVYRVSREDSTRALLAVNPSPEESRLRRIAPDDLARRLGGEVRTVAHAGEWEEAIFARDRGREVWRPLLALAGLLLLLELRVAAAGPKGEDAAGGDGDGSAGEERDATGRSGRRPREDRSTASG